MARRKSTIPTDAELSILRVLWQRGPSTVREVHTELNNQKPTGYTTVLKFMQIMVEKGLVKRDETKFAHIYKPRLSKERTQRQLVGEILDKAFGGSTAELVAQALTSGKATPEELAEIRELLDDLERGRK